MFSLLKRAKSSVAFANGRTAAWAGSSDVHLTLRNAGGSVQHYYHFLLGFLVPLVETWNSLATLPHVSRVSVRSCAVMDRILRELQLPGLAIMNAGDHAAVCMRTQEEMARGRMFATAEGYDWPSRYKAEVFQSVRNQLFFRFSSDIRAAIQTIEKSFAGTGPRVLIIGREPPGKFYSAPECEIKTSGTERRSIANMAELCAAVRRDFGNVLATTLEGRSLVYQMALFTMADIVVAQHGAALANLIWARQGTQVLEIIPKDISNCIEQSDFFGELSGCLGLKHTRLWQDSLHSAISAAELLGTLRDMRVAPSPAAV